MNVIKMVTFILKFNHIYKVYHALIHFLILYQVTALNMNKP